MSQILDNLNKEQRAAVEQTEGPMLILAGAGSGKTKALTSKIAYLLEKGVAPYKILAITFTNKAATEMRQRVNKLVGPYAKDVWLLTFHSFCCRILRIDIDKVPGYTREFSIYDTTDCKNVLKEVLRKLNLDVKYYPLGGLLSTISNAKNAMLDPTAFAKAAQEFHMKKVAEIYAEYEKSLKANNAVDFDDLLLLALKLLTINPEVREKYQSRFNYVLIDEYQDTNRVQYLLAKILTDKHHNLCVVGDVDQSIYGWRGADISNILDFEKDYKEAKVIMMEQNYRSTQVILDAANAVIKNNVERKPKRLWTENSNGTPIIYYQARDDRDEADFTVKEINKMKNKGGKLGDIAILYRTNAQSRMFEEALVKSALPYTIVGGLKFYDRMEIKDVLAYLKTIYNLQDSQSFKRIVNVPKRGIGNTTVDKLEALALSEGVSLCELVLQKTELVKLGRTSGKLEKLSDTLYKLKGMIDQMPVKDLINEVVMQTGCLEELENEHTPQAEGRIENIYELMRIADEFAESDEENTLENFLAHVSLVADIDDAKFTDDKLTLMTIHSAKGLEFPVIFVAGMEEGMFPSSLSLDDDAQLEEERRLCYVAITRAKEKLYLTAARSRMVYGRVVMFPPSRFLREIPRALIEQEKPKTSLPSFGQTKQFLQKKFSLSDLGEEKGKFVPEEGKNVETFTSGDKVMHNVWGQGTIISAKDKEDCQEVKVAFPGKGVRTILTKYAVIKKV